MSNQRGFSKIVLIIVVLILIGSFLLYIRLVNKSSIDKYQPEPPASVQQQSTSSAKNNFSQKSSQTSQPLIINDNFKSSGELNRSNSVWNFTARKYDPKADSWSTDGTYKLEFTDNSMCQSVTVKLRKCTDFIFIHDRYGAVEIKGTKKDHKILVSNLVIIQ